MSDQEKNLQDEELDKVSGGRRVSDPIEVNRSATDPVRDREVRNPAFGDHREPPP